MTLSYDCMMVNSFSSHLCHGQFVAIFFLERAGKEPFPLRVLYCRVPVQYGTVGTRICMSGRLLTERW
jgi:hypothetical protein